MSFRLRVVLLIVLLVATSTGATAWLTLRQASRELSDSVAASRHDAAVAVDALSAYGRLHGSWRGVAGTVRDLADQLHQRIRLETAGGEPIADSDLLAGRRARAVTGAPTTVNPQPALPPLAAANPDARSRTVITLVDAYRRGWLFAACLTESGIGVQQVFYMKVSDGRGQPIFPLFEAIDDQGPAVDACRQRADSEPFDSETVTTRGRACVQRPDERTCLQNLLTEQIGQVAPPSLRLYIGAQDENPHGLSSGSIVTAASAVMLAAILSALLLSRRVLRPIGTLIAASRRVGAGDLAERVTVTGHDELAELGHAFNRMAQSLAQSEERQRRLIADVAHELRTPLANLRGYLEALADGVIAPSPELFHSLHDEALLHQRIVDDLQDLALAEAGRLAYHRATVDLCELAETCHTAHSVAAEAAGIALRIDTAEPVGVQADPDRLRQVLSNLIRNAVAATPPGGTITLRVRGTGGRASIEVGDTGKGIAAPDLPHVFDRFWRADTARGRGGSGLGLAIARQIVTDHGGTIAVTSRLGAGTTFTIDLPATPADAEQRPR
ncbi:two-component sensor histidine kinase [Frankia sp. CcI49]|uniref:sensor histidine kinase n=1 Tax=Frankia sp. CcI49 TaxID=1745382 RepID=UPI0006CA18D2|nr:MULTISPECIES: HAMP domain-containing sensor histidine kinase [unclassified Frankia]KPM50902.1 histidine kinase [Frankia sp. R43]ONH60721.1 two-component sensor histidine kinase [Frankia sp. CcI49]